MVEIILEDLVGTTDQPGVEILMSEIGAFVLVELSSGGRGGTRVQSGGVEFSLLTSSQAIRNLLSGGTGQSTISSQSARTRTTVSAGRRSRFETGTMRS